MCQKNDLPLSLKSDTFNALCSDFDQILRSTLNGMEETEQDVAEINVKVKITLTPDSAPDFTVSGSQQTRSITKPKFDHAVSAVIQKKEKKTGTLSGNYELVWDRETCQYVMRPIDNGQVSLFDRDKRPPEEPEEPVGLSSGKPSLPPANGIIDADYRDLPKQRHADRKRGSALHGDGADTDRRLVKLGQGLGGDHVLGVPPGHHPPVPHEDGLGADQKGVIGVVGGHQNTETGPGKTVHYAEDLDLIAVVQIGGGLVHHQIAGLLGQCPGHQYHLPLAAGELLELSAGQVADLKLLHGFRHRLPVLLPVGGAGRKMRDPAHEHYLPGLIGKG